MDDLEKQSPLHVSIGEFSSPEMSNIDYIEK